ncbi:glycosyltransferase family 2 protein [Hymenobacter jejuensis]|uniref:Glycosyltransferase n=1 Tax=Hymenobacter jejuensis TaxID=2502781 RepID=A0A5B7ZWE9_9BACT|nr:glycosyltransferase [Hymenobacter jejuensis]QDA59270.1 glycosyltransferase [Hymenobacter jejuensis]
MSYFFPYQITHVYLNQQLTLPALTYHRQGNYLVFWWKETAVGHLYIEPEQTLSEEQYYSALSMAITPTIRHFANKKHTNSDSWQTWLAQRDNARLATWMDSIFPTPPTLPKQVPVSVIICTRNRATLLRRCLLMLRMLACMPREIIVVDNAPIDEASQKVTQDFEEVIYVVEPHLGLDRARNTGVKTARFPVVAFVDDDVVVHPFLVYRVWETFQESSVAAMTGLVIAMSLETEAQFIFEQYWSFNRGYINKMYTPDYVRVVNKQAPPVWEIGAGANMAFRKSIFEEIGYFDELLDVGAAGCSGDSELWHRILIRGHSIEYNPWAIVYHEHRRDATALKRQLFYYMRGHAAAALIQQEYNPQAGYEQYLYKILPKYYFDLAKTDFPHFRYRSRTLWAEMKGLVSGIAFYYRNRKGAPKPSR